MRSDKETSPSDAILARRLRLTESFLRKMIITRTERFFQRELILVSPLERPRMCILNALHMAIYHVGGTARLGVMSGIPYNGYADFKHKTPRTTSDGSARRVFPSEIKRRRKKKRSVLCRKKD